MSACLLAFLILMRWPRVDWLAFYCLRLIAVWVTSSNVVTDFALA